MDQPLHPNLAQLVAARDEIIERWRANTIEWSEARRQMLTLVARDDQGVMWMLNPDDGAWYRRTRDGKLVQDVPPAFGVATPTAFDLSNGDPFRDPHRRITHTAVDPNAWVPAESLVGATQRVAPLAAPAVDSNNRDMIRTVIAVIAALVVLVALWFIWR